MIRIAADHLYKRPKVLRQSAVFLLHFVAMVVVLRILRMENVVEIEDGWLFGSALALTVANYTIRPFLTILTLPIVYYTRGAFYIVVNGVVFLIAGQLLGGVKTFGIVSLAIAGSLSGLINYILVQIVTLGRRRYAPNI